jgi:putative zinc finger/helix-turn-helix YgiT family protein
MNSSHPKVTKRPFGAEKPFPWKCHHCFKNQVVMKTESYDAEFRHDGRLHTFTVPTLRIPVCEACGEKVFTEEVDDQITDALRSHLHLLTPEEIRAGLERLDMTQKEAAERLGIAEATLSRWLTDTQIQSRALDNLLRVFFAVPEVRAVLQGTRQDPKLGTKDTSGPDSAAPGLNRIA